MKGLTTFVVIGLLSGYKLVHVEGFCDFIWVDGASANQNLNGEYQVTGLWCDGHNTWLQIYPGIVNFIMFIESSDTWLIGPGTDDLCTIDTPRAKAGGDYDYPYDVPAGTWKELSSGGWRDSPDLHVYCDTSLTAGEIAGIVIGCIFGAVLILAVVLMLCSYCRKKRHEAQSASHQQQPQPPPPSHPPQTAVEAATARASAAQSTQPATRPTSTTSNTAAYQNQAYYPYPPPGSPIQSEAPPPYEAPSYSV